MTDLELIALGNEIIKGIKKDLAPIPNLDLDLKGLKELCQKIEVEILIQYPDFGL